MAFSYDFSPNNSDFFDDEEDADGLYDFSSPRSQQQQLVANHGQFAQIQQQQLQQQLEQEKKLTERKRLFCNLMLNKKSTLILLIHIVFKSTRI